jgi:glycosyltransferase involved in cell wall biosynthesis
MRVAIVHYWLVNMRGGERVIEALLELYPDADLFTNIYAPAELSPRITARRVVTTFVDRLPGARRAMAWFLPLMPLALEQLDLSEYDLVISSESGPAKGIVTRPDALHVCYCHSPMRYVWDLFPLYRARAGFLARRLMPLAVHYLRLWDQASARRPNIVIANSSHTKRRVAAFWHRDAEIIHPPVETGRFRRASARGDYFLCLGQLEPYKRVDIAIDACESLGVPLVVIGEGTEMRALKRRARSFTRFLGRQPDDVVDRHLAECRALLFPGEEDFGIVPVEAMSAGRPVIAYGHGGALDSVRDGETGILFTEQSPKGMADAIQRFVATEASFDPARIVAHASRFDRRVFQEKFDAMVRRTLGSLHLD